jgi:predicted small metal-binding protein
MKTLACSDLGMSCPFVAKGNTNEEVIKAMSEHGKKAHADQLKASAMSPSQMEEMMKKAIKEA